MPYSVTKPFAAVCALLLADRGVLDLDAPLTTYWPELTARTTMREVLAHRSGLVVLDEDAPEEVFYDWDRMCTLLAKQPPAWEPGTAHGESALFYGHLVGEVVRRTDGRSLGRFLADEVCGPLSLDFQVGVAEQDLGRVADLTGFDEEFRRAGVEGRSDLYVRALDNPPGALDPAVLNRTAWRTAEVPAVNGHGTARAVAGLYVALEQGLLLTEDLRARATAPAGTEAGPGPRRRAQLGAQGRGRPRRLRDGRDRRELRVVERDRPLRDRVPHRPHRRPRPGRPDRERAARRPGAAAGVTPGRRGVIARPPYLPRASCARVHPCGNRGPGDEPPTRMSELP